MTDQRSMASSQTNLIWDEAVCLSVIGRLLQTYPDQESLTWFTSLADDATMRKLTFVDTQPAARDAAQRMDEWLNARLPSDSVGELRELEYDHVRLFVGPGQPLAPLWESVHVSGEALLFQSVTRDVRRWYHRFEMASSHEDNEPDDHLGLEFAFLGVLAARAAESTDEEARAQLRHASSEFWHQHPGRWVTQWADLIDACSRHPFYQDLGVVVRGLAAAMIAVHSQPHRDGLENPAERAELAGGPEPTTAIAN